MIADVSLTMSFAANVNTTASRVSELLSFAVQYMNLSVERRKAMMPERSLNDRN